MSRTEAIIAAIDKQREEAEFEGRAFTGLTDRNKISKRSEPLIVWQTWIPSVEAGSSLICELGIANPSATRKSFLFVHLFVGTPLFLGPPDPPSLDLPQPLIDPRFPRLTLPRFDGLVLEPGKVSSVSFALTTPAIVERSNYFAHALLVCAAWHEQCQCHDRSLFLFEIV